MDQLSVSNRRLNPSGNNCCSIPSIGQLTLFNAFGFSWINTYLRTLGFNSLCDRTDSHRVVDLVARADHTYVLSPTKKQLPYR